MAQASLEAIRRGFQIVPIRTNTKRPTMTGWPSITWDPETTLEQFHARLAEWGFDPGEDYNIGAILGESSGHLVEVDIDHPKARRFRDLLPRTQARSGRPGSPDSHFWYIAEGAGTPSTRRYKLADQQTVTVEFRYDRGAQTVIPPSNWVPKDWDKPSDEGGYDSDRRLVEIRNWSRQPWGGDAGPARVNGRKLALQVALMGLATTLLDEWPTSGSRHDAYLALAGGLLRLGENLVHPFWERNASVLIRALATASQDDDGPDAREAESVDATVRNIRTGKPVTGFPRLATIIGDKAVDAVRVAVSEVESLAGFISRQATSLPAASASSPGSTFTAPSTGTALQPTTASGAPTADDVVVAEIVEELGSWGGIDLDPYLNGTLPQVAPTVLVRDDGHALFYPGRLNMLFAPSESGKTLLALYTCMERMAAGERVVYIDFEDEPGNTIERLRTMGASDDDLRTQFTYVRPDGPIATMQRDKWGNVRPSPVGDRNAELFKDLLDDVDPALIVADGMTSIYGLHGLDSNNSVETDVITSWLKSLCRNGRATVVLIDHMAKAAERGSMPIGSQHKVSMVQGTLLQVWPKRQPVLGSVGEVELLVLKDRPGQVRKHAGRISGKVQVAAVVIIDSTVSGGTQTRFTINSPSTAGSASGPSGSQTSLQLDLTANAAFKKLELQEARTKLFLSAFDNEAGKVLRGKEITTKIGPTWTAMKWSNTALATTRDRLIQEGYIEKNGGERGPNVTYTLLVAQVVDDDTD